MLIAAIALDLRDQQVRRLPSRLLTDADPGASTAWLAAHTFSPRRKVEGSVP